MVAMNRAQFFKELLPGINKLFGLEYKTYDNQWKELYEVQSSDRSFEEETKLAGLGQALRKDEGMGVSYDAGQEAWTSRYDHETFALAFALTEEAMEDNLYDNLIKRYTKTLARAFAYAKETKAVVPFNNGFTAYTVGDAQNLFSTAHPLVSGGTNANRPVVAVDLNETAIENMAIQIAAWTDERGLLIAARPKKMIIPPGLQFVATRLLETQNRVGTADNDISAIYSNGTIPGGYTVNNYLTDADAWFIQTDVPNGMKHFERVALKMSMDGDFDTRNVRYKGRTRYSFGNSEPLGVWGSPGA